MFIVSLLRPLVLVSIGGIHALAASTALAQSVIWPDTTAPCDGTLQACLDGLPPGMYVQIIDDEPGSLVAGTSNELVLSKDVTLIAPSGRSPVFPDGLSIRGTFNEPVQIEVAGIGLRNGGVRFVSSHGAGSSQFGIRRMDLVDSTGGNGIRIEQTGAGTSAIDVSENRYQRIGGPGSALALLASSGRVEGTVEFNRVRIVDSDTSAYGMYTASSNAGISAVHFHGNEIRGAFTYGGLCAVASASSLGGVQVGEVLFHSNVLVSGPRGGGTGICVFGGENNLHVDVDHNTVIGYNTALRHIVRPFSTPASTGSITGRVSSNLFAHNQTGWRRDTIASTVGNGGNLFFGHAGAVAGSAPPTLAGNTVFADPRLRWREFPYLKADSPAIDAADPVLPALATQLRSVDAAGSRRHKGAARDIGAYEHGDLWLAAARAGNDNTQFNWFYVPHPSLNEQPAARLWVTPFYDLGETNTRPFGVWYDTSLQQWSVFNQDQATMPLGAAYQVFVPSPGPGNFLHQVPAAGTFGNEFELDDASVNGNRDAVVLVTQNWNPPGSAGVYHVGNISVQTYAGNNWSIRSSAVSIPALSAFNVYAQDSSPSAYIHYTNVFNSWDQQTYVWHPMLDNTPCARIQVTPHGSFDGHEFELDYVQLRGGGGAWRVQTSAPMMPLGARLSVVFSSEQVFECADRIFEHDFEPAS